MRRERERERVKAIDKEGVRYNGVKGEVRQVWRRISWKIEFVR